MIGIPLIDVRERHFLVADFLYRPGQLADLIPILLVGRGGVQREQVAQRIVRLSRMAAEGCGVRPSTRRNSMRKSSTMASKQPTLNQIYIC